MCEICNGENPDELFERYREQVEAVGWVVIAVGYGDDYGGDLPHMYTIGLNETFGHPELVTVGVDLPMAHHLIDVVAHWVAEGEHLAAGDRFTHHDDLIRVRAVHPSRFRATSLLNAWKGYYERYGSEPERRAVQLVWPRELFCSCHRQPDLSLPAALTGRTGGPAHRPNRPKRRKAHRR